MQKLEKSEKAREEIEEKLFVQDAKMGKTLLCFIQSWSMSEWNRLNTLELRYIFHTL